MAQASCPQCSALVEFPPFRLSAACPYCRSPLVATDLAGQRPDLVAPFRVTKEQAAWRLQQHLRSRVWSPTAIRRGMVPEKLEGLLVPFWVHDGVARSRWRGKLGIHYYRTVRRGGKTHVERETEWFDTQGTHVAEFANHLVSASKGLSEAEANQLEPYDLGLAKPYDETLVAGWVAELPTIDVQEAARVAADELEQAQKRAIARFIPADATSGLANDTELEGLGVKLVLLPAWLASYRHLGKPMRLVMNGQTGEIVGRVPLSWWKILLLPLLGLSAILLVWILQAILR